MQGLQLIKEEAMTSWYQNRVGKKECQFWSERDKNMFGFESTRMQREMGKK